MPSHRNGRHYNLVSDDSAEHGTNYTEQDFNIGIHFYARIVGKIEVPQPNHRNEIVAAMRRIRYESKTNAQRKQRVKISISIDGIVVTMLRKKMKLRWWKNQECVIYQHPIHRVFYVSHDAQDINIFSYIVRDNVTDIFMCIAFKAYSEKEAIDVVGAIGYSFEICHKINSDLLAKQKLEEHNSDDRKTPDSKHFKDSDDLKLDLKTESSTEKLDNTKFPEHDEIENSNSSNCISNNIPSSEAETRDESLEFPVNSPTCDSNTFKYEQLLRLNRLIVRQNEEIKTICNNLNSIKMTVFLEQQISRKARGLCHKIDKENLYLLKELENVRDRIESMEQKFQILKNHGILPNEDNRENSEPITMSFRNNYNQDIFENSFSFHNNESRFFSRIDDDDDDVDEDVLQSIYRSENNQFDLALLDVVDENANFSCNES